MKTEDIDEMLQRVRDYERTSFGIKFGPDFPAFAEAVSHSKEFRGLSSSQLAIALLSTLQASEGDARKLLDQNPMRDGLLLALYAGYKLGVRDSEMQKLEKEFSRG